MTDRPGEVGLHAQWQHEPESIFDNDNDDDEGDDCGKVRRRHNQKEQVRSV